MTRLDVHFNGKIPVEMCQFTSIPMTRSNALFTLLNYRDGMYSVSGQVTYSSDWVMVTGHHFSGNSTVAIYIKKNAYIYVKKRMHLYKQNVCITHTAKYNFEFG